MNLYEREEVVSKLCVNEIDRKKSKLNFNKTDTNNLNTQNQIRSKSFQSSQWQDMWADTNPIMHLFDVSNSENERGFSWFSLLSRWML
jgi:hypothetical protein